MPKAGTEPSEVTVQPAVIVIAIAPRPFYMVEAETVLRQAGLEIGRLMRRRQDPVAQGQAFQLKRLGDRVGQATLLTGNGHRAPTGG